MRYGKTASFRRADRKFRAYRGDSSGAGQSSQGFQGSHPASDTQLEMLDEPKPIDQLKIAVEQAEEYGALENRWREDQMEIRNDVKTLEIKLSKQSLWAGFIEEIEGLCIPSLETIDEFDDRTDKAELTAAELKSESKKLHGAQAEIEQQIEQLRLEQEAPTEEDLQNLRDAREQGWQLVRRAIEGDSAPDEEVQDFIRRFEPAITLADAFEASVRQTDEIADRLRREADRVANLARLIAEKAAQEKQVKRINEDLDIAEKKLTEINNEWSKLWQRIGITPRTPREMRGWAQNHAAMAEKAAEIRERKSETDALQKSIDKRRSFEFRRVSKGFWNVHEDISSDEAYVVAQAKESFPRFASGI